MTSNKCSHSLEVQFAMSSFGSFILLVVLFCFTVLRILR